MLITVMLSRQYQNNMLLATNNIECQDDIQKKSLAKSWIIYVLSKSEYKYVLSRIVWHWLH